MISVPSDVKITVVITTRNRVQLLRNALRSCYVQEDVSFEVLVYDDASTDETSSVVKTEFSWVRLFTMRQRQGYITLRNRGYVDANGTYVVSIDDDAEFTSPDTLAQVVENFQKYPNAAALALPYFEPNCESRPLTNVALQAGRSLRSYVGCAHAVRREVFIRLGGYSEILVHQGEERDFCIRILAAGKDIVYCDCPPIVHYASPLRSVRRLEYFGYRNTIYFVWMRFPARAVLPRLVICSMQLAIHTFSVSQFPIRMGGVIAGFFGWITHPYARQPVNNTTYRLMRSLPMHGPICHCPASNEDL